MHYTRTFLKKLLALENTPGTNDKLAIVKTFEPDERMLAALAVDPRVNFYVRNLPETWFEGDGEWDGSTDELLLKLSSRRLAGNEAKLAVTKELERLNVESREVLRRVLLKDLKCKVGATLLNKAFPGTVQEYPYMRCSLPDKSNMPKWTEADWARGVISQLKADGMFASLTTTENGVRLLSRQGSPFPSDALPDLHTRHEALTGWQLHGELLVYQGTELMERQIGNGILNSLLQGGELDPQYSVAYVVWDMIPAADAVPGGKCGVPYLQRLENLRGQIEECPGISLIETTRVFSKAQAYEHYFNALGRGLEGTIIKHPGGFWKDTTSKDCVKLKLEVDVELRFKGFTPGSGKNADTFGSVTMGSEDDLLEVDVAGWTDAAREDLWARRKSLSEAIFTVRSNQILNPSPSNEKYSLFLPRIVEERKDKRVADTLQQIKDQFAAAVKKS